MRMDYDLLVDHLSGNGLEIVARSFLDSPAIVVQCAIGDHQVKLVHFEKKEEFTELPRFHVVNPEQYGQIAHLLYSEGSPYGFLCISDRDSISVNYDQPHLAIEASLQRHIALLSRALLDPDWNMKELVREFGANWEFLCDESSELVLAIENRNQTINIFKPVQGASAGFDSKYLGITDSSEDLNSYSHIVMSSRDGRRRKSHAKGFVLSVPELPAPPRNGSCLGEWYINLLQNLPDTARQEFVNRSGGYKSTEFWVVINGPTPSGMVWFALHLKSKSKGSLPKSIGQLEKWTLGAQRVALFNKEAVMPRSGANTSLSMKSVLLVGCGSVGCEIAMRLGSAGISHLFLTDPDTFSIDNLYRHTLPVEYIGMPKSIALSWELKAKYPWMHANGFLSSLLDEDVKLKSTLESFDLVVIAIGSPTQERLFHDFLIEKKVKAPVINTWLEGYGIGGHATLDIPESKGCLKCAYVDPETLGRGLSSNLNFLEDNQSLVVNHAGCGQLYLPYSGLHSAQTALIATDLAIKYLRGQLQTSSKVSWKGDGNEAISEGFLVTHRFENFDQSLKVMPLHNEHCDLCNE